MTEAQQPTAYPPKSEWGVGPWQDEPDRLEWRHEGVPCLAVRNMELGTWCGYAAVEPGHPWHGDEPDALVHGGITFATRCSGKICHVPQAGESEDVWWLGFDCCHGGDLMPGTQALLRRASLPDRFTLGHRGDVYRDLPFVRAECERLAEQVIAARTL